MLTWRQKAIDNIRDRLDPLVGRRFCKVEMNGCMATERGKEMFGTIIKTQISNPKCYDGNQSEIARYVARKTGKDKWALVRYDDGAENLEPAWWFTDEGKYIEYCI